MSFIYIPGAAAERKGLAALAWEARTVVAAFKVAMLGLALQTALAAAIPTLSLYALAHVIDVIASHGSSASLLRWIGAYAALQVAAIGLRYVGTYLTAWLHPHIELHVIGLLNNAIFSVPFSVAEQVGFIDQTSRLNISVFRGPVGLITELGTTLTSALTAVGLLSYLLGVAPALVLVVLLAAVPDFLLGRRHTEQTRKLWQRQSQAQRLVGYLLRTIRALGGEKELRLVNAFRYLEGRWRAQRLELLGESQSLLRRHSLQRTSAGLGGVVLMGAALIWLTTRGLHGVLAIGTIAAAFQALSSGFGQVNAFSGNINSLYGAALSTNEVADFIAQTAAYDGIRIAETADEPAPWPSGPPRIEVAGVSMTYPGAASPAIRDLDLVVESGESIAIVGENGSGKTTFVKTLLGLYPYQGAIRYGGRDLADYDRRAFLDSVTILFQDFAMYQLSLRENVGLGRVERLGDDAALEAALKAAGGWEIYERFARWDNLVELEFGMGTGLSVGQWQRIAIARAFFRNTPLLALDEPTSALDPLAEANLLSLVLELMRDRTVIIVSHRLSVCPRVDKIVVMQHGRIVQFGHHHELVAVPGPYREMYETQSEWYNQRAN